MEELLVSETSGELVVIANKIKTGLMAFEDKKAELIQLRDYVDGLDITSTEDKAAIRQVAEGRKKLKATRVEIEKEGKSMRDPLTALAKGISAKENELVALIEPTEKKLLAKEKWVKDENERIDREQKEAQAKLIQGRVDSLSKYGYAIDINLLTGLTNDQFIKVVDDARILWEKEEQVKAEEANKLEEERARIAKERLELEELRKKQAEAERILKERQEEIDLRDRESKQREEEEKIYAQKKKEDALKKERFEPRKAQLIELGFVQYNGVDFSLEDTWSTYWEQVFNMSDEEWESYLEDIKDAIDRRRHRLEEEEKKRASELEKARLRGIEEAKQESERKAAEETERVNQASDKEKFNVIMSHLENMPTPAMKSAKHKKLLSEVQELRNKIIAHIKTKA